MDSEIIKRNNIAPTLAGPISSFPLTTDTSIAFGYLSIFPLPFDLDPLRSIAASATILISSILILRFTFRGIEALAIDLLDLELPDVDSIEHTQIDRLDRCPFAIGVRIMQLIEQRYGTRGAEAVSGETCGKSVAGRVLQAADCDVGFGRVCP